MFRRQLEDAWKVEGGSCGPNTLLALLSVVATALPSPNSTCLLEVWAGGGPVLANEHHPNGHIPPTGHSDWGRDDAV